MAESYIFFVSTGRTGTMSCSERFAGVPGVAAYHENLSTMFTENEQRLMYALQIRQNIDAKILLETSHGFIKYFYPLALGHLKNIRIVQLVRDPIEVANSMCNRGNVLGVGRMTQIKHPKFKDKMFHLRPSRAVCLPFVNNEWSDFQYFLWEWFECHLRGQMLSRHYPYCGWGFHDIDTVPSELASWIGHEGHRTHANEAAKPYDVSHSERLQEASDWYNSFPKSMQFITEALVSSFVYQGFLKENSLISRVVWNE